jgi:hypothetical protein
MTCHWFYGRFLLIALCVAIVSPAAPVEHDAGAGLVYYRIHELPGDLPPKPEGRVPACIVDLRYVKADNEAATALVAWLRFRATPRTPVFVLANRDTAAALLKPLATHAKAPGILSVGIPGGDFHPDVAVQASGDTERRAYDALEKGTPLAAVVADNPDKVRNDEASLSRDRLAEAAVEEAGDILVGKRAVPPIDATLQRAIHLHRSLVALKKI